MEALTTPLKAVIDPVGSIPKAIEQRRWVAAVLLLSVFTGAGVGLRLVMAVLMGVGGVYVWVNRTEKKRISLLEEQLPDSIELMVRSLRVGHPFSTAVGIVAKEIPDPLGSEFGVISDESAYGRDVK